MSRPSAYPPVPLLVIFILLCDGIYVLGEVLGHILFVRNSLIPELIHKSVQLSQFHRQCLWNKLLLHLLPLFRFPRRSPFVFFILHFLCCSPKSAFQSNRRQSVTPVMSCKMPSGFCWGCGPWWSFWLVECLLHHLVIFCIPLGAAGVAFLLGEWRDGFHHQEVLPLLCCPQRA